MAAALLRDRAAFARGSGPEHHVVPRGEFVGVVRQQVMFGDPLDAAAGFDGLCRALFGADELVEPRLAHRRVEHERDGVAAEWLWCKAELFAELAADGVFGGLVGFAPAAEAGEHAAGDRVVRRAAFEHEVAARVDEDGAAVAGLAGHESFSLGASTPSFSSCKIKTGMCLVATAQIVASSIVSYSWASRCR